MNARRSPSPATFSLRLARETDFETLHAIDQVCYSPAVAYTRDELRWYLSLRGAECTVAAMRGRAKASRVTIAGFIVSVSRNKHGHIVTIDVLKIHRRTGIGTALLRRAEARMKRRGVAEVWLETATNNEAAIAFWEKHGYRSRGRLADYYPDGVDGFAMCKLLADSATTKN
jgi:[ribosomal protein S18]-alanine N-acetyltransferase